jgi:hypothetical protein
MPELRLQAHHKPVVAYYQSLDQLSLLHATHEGAVRSAFGTLLQNGSGSHPDQALKPPKYG